MATECDQQAVLCFIKERGGRVKNVDLTDHFRATIPKDPALKQVAKEAFKRYVDNVAYVKEENGEKYVCLKKRFRKAARSDDRDGPVDELLPTAIPPEASDSSGGVNEEGVNGRTESELRADMGNSISSTAEDKIAASPRTDRPQAPRAERPARESQRTNGEEGRSESRSQEEAGKENRPRCARLGQINDSTDGEQPDSSRRTPQHSRKQFTEALTSSSPQLRRSVALRSSVYLSGRCKDCPRADSDYEPAAVSLEPLEHEWMMCASDGHWESLRRLLVRDPSLITRKDFVTGFTCLHWAAKLGKDELIVLLFNFAKQHQVAVNVNARSGAGYTPLHVAAMHGHLEVVKLLVGAFDADVEARDYNGRKACQYLKSDIEQNLLDIVGACVDSDADSVDVGDASRWRLSRVIQSNFRPLKAQNSGDEDGGGFSKQKSLRRKSSFTKMKPSLNKIRLRTQIVHSTSLFDRFEKEPTEELPNPLRPKSNVFG